MEALSVGFNTIIITTNTWTRDNINPSSIAMNVGLHVIEDSLVDTIPSSTFTRPIVSIAHILHSLLGYLSRGNRSEQLPIVIISHII